MRSIVVDTARMKALNECPHQIWRWPGIDAGRCQMAMAEQFLDDPQVGAALVEMGGKCMAQRMSGQQG